MRLLMCLLLCSGALQGSDNEKILSKYHAVIIAQFGKVGSTSLFHLFSEMTPDRPLQKVGYHPTKGRAVHTHNLDVVEKFLAQKKKILIVNVSRSLFTRNMSEFFSNIDKPDRYGYIDIQSRLLNPKFYPQDKLMTYFKAFNWDRIEKLSSWYTTFHNLLGINLFSEPFDFEKKAIFLTRPKFDLLFLRFEDIVEWPQILQNIMGLEDIVIPRKNIGKQKWYKDLYALMKLSVSFTQEESDAMKALDFMQHFYP